MDGFDSMLKEIAENTEKGEAGEGSDGGEKNAGEIGFLAGAGSGTIDGDASPEKEGDDDEPAKLEAGEDDADKSVDLEENDD